MLDELEENVLGNVDRFDDLFTVGDVRQALNIDIEKTVENLQPGTELAALAWSWGVDLKNVDACSTTDFKIFGKCYDQNKNKYEGIGDFRFVNGVKWALTDKLEPQARIDLGNVLTRLEQGRISYIAARESSHLLLKNCLRAQNHLFPVTATTTSTATITTTSTTTITTTTGTSAVFPGMLV